MPQPRPPPLLDHLVRAHGPPPLSALYTYQFQEPDNEHILVKITRFDSDASM